jgi:hypothetical protein
LDERQEKSCLKAYPRNAEKGLEKPSRGFNGSVFNEQACVTFPGHLGYEMLAAQAQPPPAHWGEKN